MMPGDLVKLPEGHGFGIVFKVISDVPIAFGGDVIEANKTVIVLVDEGLDYYDASSCEVISESW